MRLKPFIRNGLLLTGLLVSMAAGGTAAPAGEFPYHLETTVVKQKIYHHPLEEVWETALTAAHEVRDALVEKLKENGLAPESRSAQYKQSGLITFSVSHKGKKGFLMRTTSLFSYQGLFLEPLGKQKTSVSSREITFRSYDRYVFHGGQLARYLDFTPAEENILDVIQDKLRERSHESK